MVHSRGAVFLDSPRTSTQVLPVEIHQGPREQAPPASAHSDMTSAHATVHTMVPTLIGRLAFADPGFFAMRTVPVRVPSSLTRDVRDETSPDPDSEFPRRSSRRRSSVPPPSRSDGPSPLPSPPPDATPPRLQTAVDESRSTPKSPAGYTCFHRPRSFVESATAASPPTTMSALPNRFRAPGTSPNAHITTVAMTGWREL